MCRGSNSPWQHGMRAGWVTLCTHLGPSPLAFQLEGNWTARQHHSSAPDLQLCSKTRGSNRRAYFKGIPPSTLYASQAVIVIRQTLTIARRNSVPRVSDSDSARVAEVPPRALC